jgi:hypothetical protein
VDSQLWHDYCTARVPEEPPRATVRQWNAMPDHQREAHVAQLSSWLANLFVQTDELSAIAVAVSNTVQVNAYSPPGAKRVPALTGENFVGKSTLMMRWARTRYNEWTAGADRDARGRPVIYPARDCEADLCPVVWIDLPAAALIKDVDGAILTFFNLPSDGVKREVSRSAVNAVQRHRTRVVVVDDVHLLKTNWKGGRDVLDHVKHLNTELGQVGVTLILVGANLDGGDLVNDPQIAARLKLRRFTPYTIGNTAEMRTWQAIVYQLETQLLPHLPRGKPGMLFTKLAGELWHRTQGYLGDLTTLVGGAALAAINDGTFKILLKHLDSMELSERAERERHEAQATHHRTKAVKPQPA